MSIEQLYQLYKKHQIICTDTRNITPGCLFFALKGDNFNGNTFAKQAIQEGAKFAIVDEILENSGRHFIKVDDVLLSLQELAKYHRQLLNIPIVGITGSNGKTTTKELTESVLSQHFKCFATKGNLNNHIGVPISILSITDEIEIAIIEMGANHQKEIEFLCTIAQPTHGLITNIGKAHLDGFGGLEGVKKGKGELYQFLSKNNGMAFINQSNNVLVDMSRDYNLECVIDYGSGADNLISGKIESSAPYLVVEWHRERMEYDDRWHLASSQLTGNYNFENILAAICIGSYFKLSPEAINQGIKNYIPTNNRSQVNKTALNTIICDYYNANPSSIKGALENLAAFPGNNKVMILGDMFELGNESLQEHKEIVQLAETINVDKRIFVGPEFYKMKNTKDFFYQTSQQAYEALKSNPIIDSTVLVKGSRGMKLEALIELL